jgi:hypothetical protein
VSTSPRPNNFKNSKLLKSGDEYFALADLNFQGGPLTPQSLQYLRYSPTSRSNLVSVPCWPSMSAFTAGIEFSRDRKSSRAREACAKDEYAEARVLGRGHLLGSCGERWCWSGKGVTRPTSAIKDSKQRLQAGLQLGHA